MFRRRDKVDAPAVTFSFRVKSFFSRLKPRIPIANPLTLGRKVAPEVSERPAEQAPEPSIPDTASTATSTTPTPDPSPTTTATTITPIEEAPEAPAPLTASKTNPTLVSKPRRYHGRSTKIYALQALPRGIFISHTSTKPHDRGCKVFHVDPTSLPPIPLRSRRSITNFQFSRLITEKEAQTECRGLREIKARDAEKYTRIGFELTGQYVVVDSRYHGEVARTTVGWIRVERGFDYWQYLTDKDDEMVEIMRYKIWSPGTEVCRTFLRDEEVMCCRKMK
ncbi:hypothetical protein ABW19_dt0203044 [Dactylella cylindrospora]|nr:hypothetical protein ABW19_dt0203044 [Dactylella cylindrospora]